MPVSWVHSTLETTYWLSMRMRANVDCLQSMGLGSEMCRILSTDLSVISGSILQRWLDPREQTVECRRRA
jgi:hypothetical protein